MQLRGRAVSEPGIGVVEAHPVPAEQDEMSNLVAAVLLTGAGAAATAAEISVLLAPWHVSAAAVALVLRLIDAKAAPLRARPQLSAFGVSASGAGAEVARRAAAVEPYSRAAYVMAAASRVQAALDAGKPQADAAAAETPNLTRHLAARRKRLDAAGRTAKAAQRWGPLLGWYRDPESNSEAECRIADGANFYADEATIIGLPGSVHPHCACVAGPPHPDGEMVNDKLLGIVRLEARKVGTRPKLRSVG